MLTLQYPIFTLSYFRLPEWFRVLKQESFIFSPNLQFSHTKSIQRIRKSGTVDKDPLWFNYPKGYFEYVQSLKVTIYCPFKFMAFPFDSHYCDLTFFTLDDEVASILMNSSDVGYNNSHVR